MKTSSPCLGDISKDFAINDMKKKILKGALSFFLLILNLLRLMIF